MIKPNNISVEQLFNWFAGPIIICSEKSGQVYYQGNSWDIHNQDQTFLFADVKSFTVVLKHEHTVLRDSFSSYLEVFI